MKTNAKNILREILVGITIIFLLNSCASKYLNIKILTDGTLAWNEDRSEFAFIAATSLYRKPIGIAKFPDGGMSKTEYLDFSLYHYNIKHNKLTHLINLNKFYLGSAYRWLSISQINLRLKDSLLFYKLIKPYDHNMKYIDKEKHPDFLKDISKTYSVNIRSHQISVVDNTTSQNLFNHKREVLKYSSAKKYLSGIKYSDWGINLKKLYPQPKSTYMDYIVKKEGNRKMRQAIFEQIIPEFTQKDREKILKNMEKHKQILYKKFSKLNAKISNYIRNRRKEEYDDYILYMQATYEKLFNY